MPKVLKVPGFEFAGIACGIKGGHTPDLALIHSKVPATAVGLFTNNRVKAAPVLLSARHLKSGYCSAVIINSGNANACTGTRGMRAAGEMAARTARLLGIPIREVQVASTGKIGIPLPMLKIREGIPRLVKSRSPAGLRRAARAVLTTDDSVKIASATGTLAGKPFHLVGFAKGAGMIEPHLVPHATMLAFFMTDLKISRAILQKIFMRAADQTFNRITVDGDTSTNDTALLLANGLAGNRPPASGSGGARLFEATLRRVMEQLALQMVEDGEGGTKCVKIRVRGARTGREARRIAYAVGNSPLVKTSFFGEDPNWGRLLAAAGRASTAGRANATSDPSPADIYYDGVRVVRRGVSAGRRLAGRRAEGRAKRVMKKRTFTVTLDLHSGRGEDWVWASDLSLDYVKLNSCYRT